MMSLIFALMSLYVMGGEAFLSANTLSEIMEKGYNYTNPSYQRRAVNTNADDSYRACAITNYNLHKWETESPVSMALLGNWTGVGQAQLLLKATGTVLFSESLSDTWILTYNSTGGYVQWTDILVTPSIPDKQPDYFKRYLQHDSPERYYTCTTIVSEESPVHIDLEKNNFQLGTDLSQLINKNTGNADAMCTYQVRGNTVVGNCIYYDTIGILPPGTVYTYYLVLTRQ